MKHLFTLIFSLFSIYASGQSPYFISEPTLTPDGNTVIFTLDEDLWSVSSNGGPAMRITAMDGVERLASVSPDGNWIAFSSSQLGNTDVYVMPLKGGDIKQLTFHDAVDEVEAWSWDNEFIYFTSNRYNRYSTFKVSVNGGTPIRLYPHYFNNIHNAVEHPDGSIFFNESWESKNFAHRKRYKGAYNPDIKSYHPEKKEFNKYTDYEGKDFWATIDKEGNVYFVSDEYNDEYNLYKLEGQNKARLTDFNTSVQRPRVSANGEKIVFIKEYQLHLFDVLNGTTSKP